MGWTYTEKQRGQSVKAFFEQRWNHENEHRKMTVLECSATFKVAYLAVETIDKLSGKRDVWAAVCLIHHAPSSYYNFGYKDMEESMGPCEAECPAKVLDLLTPTDSTYAQEWRQRCRERLEKRAARPKIHQGDVVKFEIPIHFNSGAEHQTFIYVGNTTFKTNQDGYVQYYRVPGWHNRALQVVERAAKKAA